MKADKPNPHALYKAWQSFCKEGLDEVEFPGRVVRAGTLLLGDHPLVVAHPELFVRSDAETMAGSIVPVSEDEFHRSRYEATDQGQAA